MKRPSLPALAWLLAALPAASQSQAQGVVALELLLAVDASSSVSDREFDLQMRGYAEAFREPLVIQTIAAAGRGGIAVGMMHWSDSRKQAMVIDWTPIRDEAEALAFADAIDATPRVFDSGGTAIGAALRFAGPQFSDNGYSGERRVIDLSGDGITNQPPDPKPIRDALLDLGFVINGLAILNEEPWVDGYYRNWIIGGPGAFVMTVPDYQAFADGIIEKLVREIAGVAVAEGPPGGPAPDGPLAEARPR